MRIHTLQHVPFEGLGSLQTVLIELGHTLTFTHLYNREEALPETSDFDALIVMGGPMGVHDEAEYSWLATEKALILKAILETGKPILGICLGAQLIASVLGAAVTRNPTPEIGWFPLRLDPAFVASPWGACLENDAEVFHWHGDTFALPTGALPVASSAACINQGFIVDNRIVGLQFHLETTPESARALIRECGDELQQASSIQSAVDIMSDHNRFTRINHHAAALVRHWLQPFS